MPRPRENSPNNILLQAALEGLEVQRQRIDQQITQVRSMMGVATVRRGRPPGRHSSATASAPTRRKRRLSEDARQRIAAAQKRRWAEYRKNSSEASVS
jgi:hypothetical protein